jgi:DNA-binding helix-hairpin-helix protein with protein kinase domain
LIRNVNQGADEFARETRDREVNLRNLQHRWQQEASEEVFKGKLQALRVLTDEYRHLGDVRKRKVCELEKALYNLQLRRFLEQFDIASADIPHIKDGRKAMLSAYGIEDATDVSRAAMEAVPGVRAIFDRSTAHLAPIAGNQVQV